MKFWTGQGLLPNFYLCLSVQYITLPKTVQSQRFAWDRKSWQGDQRF
ncbi:hypothetical protein KKY_944 [Pelagibacterium halotolerans B2]|uniref:Uncharacterized protein n=1 Tax=Pelagibacterium halotolerans (strain DSM 22347 / JCM 15775 / CGMCC 1.7692 / B2) TaxID=1082931 RepID=G4RFT7_PELHB|nr:hypothetical protein KKY_944 [Pelagibacterium halotolerans B2]